MAKKIKIPFSEEDLDELREGRVFNWTFEGVQCEIFLGCPECERPLDDCTCEEVEE